MPLVEVPYSRWAKLRGRRKLHAVAESNGSPVGPAACGMERQWPWSINMPWTLGGSICKSCIKELSGNGESGDRL